jgi:regulator of protease activity HflC (stomatin/prohibitin superfamily)
MDPFGGLVMLAIFVFLVLGLVALAKGARTVKQYEKGLITRLGKYHGMAPSGLTFILPFVDDIVRVDMREQVITVPPQKLITKDNVTVEVDAVVYYKVIDPVKSQYEVQDFGYACTTLAQTNLRNLIGDRTLDETLVARDMIQYELARSPGRGHQRLGRKGHARGGAKDRATARHYRRYVPPNEGGTREARCRA